MKKEHLNLWQRIATFKLDDPQAARPFSTKLAEEQKWAEDFTQRVIAEYKKFAFLCVTLPNGASPSPTVDEAWHLHLTYTDSYWNQFCPKILGTQLHHHPSKGGSGENEKHADWYRQTLIGYVEIFGQIPPNDIWTMPLNFDPSEYLPKNSPFLMKKVENTDLSRETREGGYKNEKPDTSTKKPTVWEYLAYALVINLGVAILMPSLLKGTVFLLPFAALGILIAILIAQHHAQHKEIAQAKIQDTPLPLSPYIGAWIAGGNERLLTTFLYEATEKCTFQPTTSSMVFQLKKGESLYENPLYTALETVEKPEVSLNFIKETVKPYAQLIEKQLDTRDYQAAPIPANIGILLGLFSFMGLARMLEGLVFHKPLLFLGLTLIVAALVLTITHNATALNFQSWRERFTSHFQNKYAVQNGDNLMWQFALGIALSMDTNWYSFENTIRPQEQNNGGDGGSSSGCSGSGDGGGSCGGGSCGGGCGGCGS